MMKQVRPYLAVVANGFVRRVGVGLAGPDWCLIPAREKGEMRVMERARGSLSRSLGWPVCPVGDRSVI